MQKITLKKLTLFLSLVFVLGCMPVHSTSQPALQTIEQTSTIVATDNISGGAIDKKENMKAAMAGFGATSKSNSPSKNVLLGLLLVGVYLFFVRKNLGARKSRF